MDKKARIAEINAQMNELSKPLGKWPNLKKRALAIKASGKSKESLNEAELKTLEDFEKLSPIREKVKVLKAEKEKLKGLSPNLAGKSQVQKTQAPINNPQVQKVQNPIANSPVHKIQKPPVKKKGPVQSPLQELKVRVMRLEKRVAFLEKGGKPGGPARPKVFIPKAPDPSKFWNAGVQDGQHARKR